VAIFKSQRAEKNYLQKIQMALQQRNLKSFQITQKPGVGTEKIPIKMSLISLKILLQRPKKQLNRQSIKWIEQLEMTSLKEFKGCLLIS
jgi:hypothetical protein